MSVDIDLPQLHKLICDSFSLSELHQLCFELGIKDEEVAPKDSNIPTFVRELILYSERRNGLLGTLIAKCREERPGKDWPQLPMSADESIEQISPTQSRSNTESAQDIVLEIQRKPKSAEWQEQEKRLSEGIREASISEPSLNQERINTLMEEADQAEQDEAYEKAAESYAALAELLKQEKRYVQARNFARKSARCFIVVNRLDLAIKQCLFAAEVWMNRTPFATTMANADLEKAEKIASEFGNSTLLAQVFLLQAQYGILRGFRHDTEKMWKKVESLLPKVHTDFQLKISIELAIQKAMIARLDGKREAAKTILEGADSRDWPARFSHIRLELLWCLLFVHAELGCWEDVDRVYETAQRVLDKQDENQNARWLMHYAASLVRRGEADDALETYLSALDFFKSDKATPSQKHHFFQDMIYSLTQHSGHRVFSSAMNYESERLDLALNALHEDVGHLHRARARGNYFEGDMELAFSHARYALIYAWRKGDWSGLSEANKILAFLYHAEQEYISATFAAVAARGKKIIERYAPELNSLRALEEIKQVVDGLLQDWPTLADLQNALLALSKCTDIVPPDQIENVIQYTVDILQQYLSTQLADDTCRYAVQVLRLLAPQFSQEQTQQIIQFSTTSLNDQQMLWTVKREFIQLLATCFENKMKIQSKLYRPAMKVVLANYYEDVLKAEVEFALLDIAITAPAQVRNEITTFFLEHSNWDYLAILKEPIPEETLKLHVENILRLITPRQENGSISYSGRSARSINNFNEYITPSLGDFVVDGLLNAIRNPDGSPIQKSDAILALRWLPDAVLRERADEIGQFLLEVANGKYADATSNFLNWFGSEEDIRRNSLYALGHLYSFVDNRLQKQIRSALVSYSRSSASKLRMGTAMALRALEGSYRFSTELTFTLSELLHDDDPNVRHWAASAAGHRIADGNIPKNISNFIIRRLLKAAEEESNPHARAGIGYGLRILLESNNLNESLRGQAQEATSKLVNDVNYRVRRLATKRPERAVDK